MGPGHFQNNKWLFKMQRENSLLVWGLVNLTCDSIRQSWYALAQLSVLLLAGSVMYLGLFHQNLFYVRGKDGQNEVTTHRNVLFFFFTLAVSFLIRGAGKDDIFSHLVGISYFYWTQLLKKLFSEFQSSILIDFLFVPPWLDFKELLLPDSYFIHELRSSIFVYRGLPPPAAAVALHLVLLLNRPFQDRSLF